MFFPLRVSQLKVSIWASCVGGFTLIYTHGSTQPGANASCLDEPPTSPTSHVPLHMSDFTLLGRGGKKKPHGVARGEIFSGVSESWPARCPPLPCSSPPPHWGCTARCACLHSQCWCWCRRRAAGNFRTMILKNGGLKLRGGASSALPAGG